MSQTFDERPMLERLRELHEKMEHDADLEAAYLKDRDAFIVPTDSIRKRSRRRWRNSAANGSPATRASWRRTERSSRKTGVFEASADPSSPARHGTPARRAPGDTDDPGPDPAVTTGRGIPTLSLSGALEAPASRGMVRTEGLEPSLSFGETDFRTTSAFAAAPKERSWSGLSLRHRRRAGPRRRPSSLYTFLRGRRLGSGSASAPPVSLPRI